MTQASGWRDADRISWFVRLLLSWCWVVVGAAVLAAIGASALISSNEPKATAAVEIGLSDYAAWPHVDSLLFRASSSISSGELAERLDVDSSVKLTVEQSGSSGVAPITLTVSADSEEEAQRVLDLVVEELAAESVRFLTEEERALLASTEQDLADEEIEIERIASRLEDIDLRLGQIDVDLADGGVDDGLLAEERALVLDRKVLDSERNGRVNRRTELIVAIDELGDEIAVALPAVESLGRPRLRPVPGSVPPAAVAAAAAAFLALLALPTLDERFGRIRNPGALRLEWDGPVMDLRRPLSAVEQLAFGRWVRSARRVLILGNGADDARPLVSALGEEVAPEVIPSTDDLSVRELASADLVFVVLRVRSMSRRRLREFGQELALLGVQPQAVMLTGRSPVNFDEREQTIRADPVHEMLQEEANKAS